MKRKQWIFIKIIVSGNILFILSQIFWRIFHRKTYWIGSSIIHQTLWQKFIDDCHNWWYELSRESIALLFFILASIIFFFLSVIMED